MFPTQIWIVMKQSTNLELNEPIMEWYECEMLTHSQQQSQAPKTHKKESTVRLTTRITMLWAPQRSLLYRLKDSIEVKCKKHTQQSTNSTKEAETVNLTENVAKDTFKGSLFDCQENVSHFTYYCLNNQCEY